MHHNTNCNRKAFTFSAIQKKRLRYVLRSHKNKADKLIAKTEDEADQYIRVMAFPPPPIRRETPTKMKKKLNSLLTSSSTLLKQLNEIESNDNSDLIHYAIINQYKEEDHSDILDLLKNQLEKVAKSLDSFLKLDLKEVKKLSPSHLDGSLSDEEESALLFEWAVKRITPKSGQEHYTDQLFIYHLAKSYMEIVGKRPGSSPTCIFPILVNEVMWIIHPSGSRGLHNPNHLRTYQHLVKKMVSRL